MSTSRSLVHAAEVLPATTNEPDEGVLRMTICALLLTVAAYPSPEDAIAALAPPDPTRRKGHVDLLPPSFREFGSERRHVEFAREFVERVKAAARGEPAALSGALRDAVRDAIRGTPLQRPGFVWESSHLEEAPSVGRTRGMSLEHCILEVCKAGRVSKKRQPVVAAKIRRLIAAEFPLPEPGTRPRYSERAEHPKLADMNICEFLVAVWKREMDAGVLTRPELRRLDRSASKAVDNWLRHSELPASINLPTLQERNDADIADLPEMAATGQRLGMAAYRRRLKAKRPTKKTKTKKLDRN